MKEVEDNRMSMSQDAFYEAIREYDYNKGRKDSDLDSDGPRSHSPTKRLIKMKN